MIERVVALAVLVASGAYLAYALPLSRGTAARPGPGFFPVAVGVFACVVALVWVVLALRRGPTRSMPLAEEDLGPAAPGARRRVAATAGALIGFCLLLPWTGYPLVAFLFVAFTLQQLGARWMPALATGLVSAAASYYLFAVLLDVPLPRGVLFD